MCLCSMCVHVCVCGMCVVICVRVCSGVCICVGVMYVYVLGLCNNDKTYISIPQPKLVSISNDL